MLVGRRPSVSCSGVPEPGETMDWIDEDRGRGVRDRCASIPVPEQLPLLDADQDALLRRWVRGDAGRRSRASLLKEVGTATIERAESLCDCLLRNGWIVRREQLLGGTWQWDAIIWRDLPRLQALLGVSSPRQRVEQRQVLIQQANTWLQSRRESSEASAVDPDLLDELSQALVQLEADKTLRLDLLNLRLTLLHAIAAWHDAGLQGSRRDFALQARGSTKALTDVEWRWLEATFDLERLRILRFALVAWLAGDLELQWNGQRVHLGPLHCLGLPVADLRRVEAVSLPRQWWLIENRASFERQASKREAGVLLVWMPGRPPAAWLYAIAHLLRLAPAPAWISADADPAGIDIACTVGVLWKSHGLAWEAYRMGVEEWRSTAQHWPLNEHDRRLLVTLLDRTELPPELRTLCEAMQREGRKAEQEAWI